MADLRCTGYHCASIPGHSLRYGVVDTTTLGGNKGGFDRPAVNKDDISRIQGFVLVVETDLIG
jgi:hypothetical protein